MPHAIGATRIGRVTALLLACAAASCCLASQADALGTHATGCSGRTLLSCSEKLADYNDSVSWTLSFARDFELFETRIPVGLHNPALAQFWRFEAATAAARALFEFEIGNQDVDSDFELAVTRPALRAPTVKPGGVVDRTLATALNRLMKAEAQEVANLEAAGLALDRATDAQVEGNRPDWVAWQESAAAGFALGAAGAIGRVVTAERSVTRLFEARRLRFGVGSADLAAAQRTVRKHGLARRLVQAMQSLGVTEVLIAYAQSEFLKGNFGPATFSLAGELSAQPVISAERAFGSALRHFAARIPHVRRPPA
jgi:hypothetical protein